MEAVLVCQHPFQSPEMRRGDGPGPLSINCCHVPLRAAAWYN